MSGIGLVLNIAKDALLSQQYAIDVISHNIANVSTEGYSRQVAVLQAKDAAPYGGFMFGRGVQVADIINTTNEFIEKRLQAATSGLSMMSEKETYMDIMETIFSESSASSISNQLNEFWNAWNDLNNNPSGFPERNILVEYASLLSESFQNANADMSNLKKELTSSIDSGINAVNELLDQVANVNSQILLVQTTGNANDLIDQRTVLVNKIAEYMDINTYKYDDGSLSVTTSKGFVLVNRNDTYPLDFDGTDITWGDSNAVVTEDITGGKLGGWLDLRDEVIPKYSSDLDELAKSIIWEINSLHSQGIGLNGFSSLTGSYHATNLSEEMGTVDSGLDFYDKITDGSFKLWLYNPSGEVVGETTIAIDADVTTMADLAAAINGATIGGNDAINSMIKDGALYMEIDSGSFSGYTFAFSDDSSNVLSALGINTFFTASNARDMGVNESVISDKSYIAAGKISNNVGFAVGASTNTSTGIVTTSGPYTGTTEGNYELEILAGNNFRWRKDGGAWSASTSIPAGAYALGTEGVSVTFNGTFDANDTYSISVTPSSDTYGDFFPGDNTNSLNISNLQYQNVTVKQWDYSRTEGASSRDVTNTTLDDYLHQMIGSIGIESQSVQRESAYTQAIHEQISQTRDNISAVSLDEEMANLIRYQHAYMAAAKLITTAEEMLDEVLKTV